MSPLMGPPLRKNGDMEEMGGGMGSDREDIGEFSVKLDPNKHALWHEREYEFERREEKRIVCNY